MYNFVYSSSDQYAPYCLVSMASLLKNNSDLNDVNFYILSNDISDKNRDIMKKLCDDFSASLNIVDCDETISQILRGGVHLTLMFQAFLEFSLRKCSHNLIRRYSLIPTLI